MKRIGALVLCAALLLSGCGVGNDDPYVRACAIFRQTFLMHADGTVEDGGIGIPAEHIDRIFERFYRVDKSHSKEIGGTGLGLSIVRHGVAYHDGEVTLTSTEGVGTKVTVTLKK